MSEEARAVPQVEAPQVEAPQPYPAVADTRPRVSSYLYVTDAPPPDAELVAAEEWVIV